MPEFGTGDLALIERKRVLDNERGRRLQDRDDEQATAGGGAHLTCAQPRQPNRATRLHSSYAPKAQSYLKQGSWRAKPGAIPVRPGGAVVTTKRSGVVTTATRQQLRGAAGGF